jgi:ligand-binding SRPBCC domain-containing protein
LKFENSFTVGTSIVNVWDFYTQIKHLEVITPPSIGLKIIHCPTSYITDGLLVTLSGKIILFNRKWTSKITISGVHQYVDEMINGPFKKWRHTHIFEEVKSDLTLVSDKVEFELPNYFGGIVMEGVVKRNLQKIFDYRRSQTIKRLSSEST